ncbi:MAG: M15 family metallopeptidase [Caulobacterales bacterium]|nr:M15 family metallopeptidase [Caulobacterales bacterium]
MNHLVLGQTSRARLRRVHPRLVRVVERAIELTAQDFMVLEGVRTPSRQKWLYAQGRTRPGPRVTWTLNSRHFVNPATGYGHAVDLVPFPIDWSDLKKFDAISRAMFAAADDLGVTICWGADWDRDGRPRERGETDSPHFELVP